MKTILPCEYIDQSVRWPTGCESVSTVMALRYLGLPVNVDEFIREDLLCGRLVQKDGILYGPDPDHCFIGDPHTTEGSFGCYAGAILQGLEHVHSRYPAFAWQAVNETGTDTHVLLDRYVANGIPVVYWATMDMQPSGYYCSWQLEGSGKELVWKSREHCLLLTGYDTDTDACYFHDPWKNNGVICWPETLVQTRHDEMFSMAIGFRKKEQEDQTISAPS